MVQILKTFLKATVAAMQGYRKMHSCGKKATSGAGIGKYVFLSGPSEYLTKHRMGSSIRMTVQQELIRYSCAQVVVYMWYTVGPLQQMCALLVEYSAKVYHIRYTI